MNNWNKLFKRTSESIKEDGITTTLVRAKGYLNRELFQKHVAEALEDEAARCVGDVLFINGCYLPHPSRYRVSHQREQLLAGNLTSTEVFYTDLEKRLVFQYRVFVFYRCPYTETVGKFIQLAKKYHKTVLFDVDDLVIDTKYTDCIPYVNQMKPSEKKVYDEGVSLMKKTLSLCDGAITTTERLAKELSHYVKEVYINRNVMSDRMLQISEDAIYERDLLAYKDPKDISKPSEFTQYKEALRKRKERKREIRLGYFSGSITHNDDFQLILPLIVSLLKQYSNLKLYLVGELDLPKELRPYKKQIKISPFVDWQNLPWLISSVDINLAPLCENVFNEAKSENKWAEAALVKVPTIASNLGALKKMIQDGETGYLCSNEKEWEEKLTILIKNKEKRTRMGQLAYQYVLEHVTTIETGYTFSRYVKSKMKPNLVFILPTAQISGGSLVVLKHCAILMNLGIDVTILNEGYEDTLFLKEGNLKIPVIKKHKKMILGSIDKAVATLWSTVDFVVQYPNIKERYYLVQGYETNFSKAGEFFRFRANQTYNTCNSINYITISRWCQNWLKEKYEKDAQYAPNGIDTSLFYPAERDFSGKIRILVEGNCDDTYKNVDESFKITNQLDQTKYEIWYLSYQGKPKEWYKTDKFFHKIAHEKIPDIYRQCHILIKSSLLESFSYPPLEMMATGGYVVVAPNAGNIEYLRDGENCLFYEHDDLNTALEAINRIIKDEDIRKTLYKNGLKTAGERAWENIVTNIKELYYDSKR